MDVRQFKKKKKKHYFDIIFSLFLDFQYFHTLNIIYFIYYKKHKNKVFVIFDVKKDKIFVMEQSIFSFYCETVMQYNEKKSAKKRNWSCNDKKMDYKNWPKIFFEVIKRFKLDLNSKVLKTAQKGGKLTTEINKRKSQICGQMEILESYFFSQFV